jgi:hypothetical protein
LIRFHFSGNVPGLQFIVGRTAGSLLLLHARKMFPWMARLEHRLKLAKTVRSVLRNACAIMFFAYIRVILRPGSGYRS